MCHKTNKLAVFLLCIPGHNYWTKDRQLTPFQCTSGIWGGKSASYSVTIHRWTWKTFLRVWKSSHPLSPKEKGIWERGLGLAGRSGNICDRPQQRKSCSECATLAAKRTSLADVYSMGALDTRMALELSEIYDYKTTLFRQVWVITFNAQ